MPEQIKYFVPGPVYVLEEVRAAMLAPVVGHRSPEFMPVYKRITEALKPVFRTTRDVYMATSSATTTTTGCRRRTTRRATATSAT